MALTPKQERFAELVVSGHSYSESYRIAYDCQNSKPETINRKAVEVAQNNKVAQRIKELRASVMKDIAWSRRIAVERLVAINEAAVKYLTEAEDGILHRNASAAFFSSLDRLNGMLGTDERPSRGMLAIPGITDEMEQWEKDIMEPLTEWD